tara:strand:+ start:200 stop:763 length:564 start_codon:yes stop_codon:yes gene_type:complete
MMNKKEQNARMLGDKRFVADAKSMSVLPGGPENNNPMNVNDNASPQITAASIYGDYQQNYPQMGTGMVNPIAVQNSGLPQNFPMGQRLNAQPYNMQQQPDTSGAMESSRLVADAQKYGLNPGPMGMTGMPAQPAPGAFPGAFPGSSGPPMMQGMPSAEQAAGGMSPRNSMNSITPGSTKTTIKKKRA